MIVTVPDKEGRKNAFASGHVEGRQILDGIRATLAFDKLNLFIVVENNEFFFGSLTISFYG